MNGTVLTLVAPAGQLTATIIREVSAGLHRLVGASVVPVVLADDTAVDLVVHDVPANPALLTALRQEFQNLKGVDNFVQPYDDQRRKRLLVADMDATMVIGETLDDVAAHLGLGDQIAPITARAMRGELDFAEALAARVALLKGMPIDVLAVVRDGIQPSPGAATLVKTMAAHGARCVLASGGFDFFTGAVATRLGFHAHYGNRLEMGRDMRASGYVLPPILGKERKQEIVLDEAKRLGITPLHAITVGDGANDLPMLQTAGVGVAYHAKPLVIAATQFHVRYTDLTALLYLQGYKRGELVSAG